MPPSMDYASLYLKRFIFVVALGSAVPALPSASVAFAGAGNDPDESTAEPRRRFESGMAHFNLQEYDAAIVDFEQSYRLKPDPALLFNLAQAHRLAVHAERALYFYRAYLRAEPQSPARTEVEGRIREMQALLDAKPATAMPVPPPPAVVSAKAAPELAVAPPAERRARNERRAGIAVGSLGVALLALGGAFVALAKAANGDATAGGSYHGSAEDRRDGYEIGAASTFAVGAAALAAGVTLYWVGHKSAARQAMASRPRL